jgi:glutamate dehydrogenase/leucine dehydrogenase
MRAASRAGSRQRAAACNTRLREFFRHPEDKSKTGLSGDLDGKRVIVQGLGNVGYHAAKFLSARKMAARSSP